MAEDVHPPIPQVNLSTHRRVLLGVYVCAGLAICLINLTPTDARRLSDFLYYLTCAAIATIGLRLTAHHNAIPVGFLMTLLAIEDLSLPQLLFIGLAVSVLGELQETGRKLPRLSALLFSIGSGTIGIAA